MDDDVLQKLDEALKQIPKPPELRDLTNEEILDTKHWVSGVVNMVKMDVMFQAWTKFFISVLETASRIESVKQQQFENEFGSRLKGE